MPIQAWSGATNVSSNSSPRGIQAWTTPTVSTQKVPAGPAPAPQESKGQDFGSFLRNVGNGASNVGRFLGSHVAQAANQIGLEGANVAITAKTALDQARHVDPSIIRQDFNAQKIGREQYNQKSGGILNVGTFTSADDAANPNVGKVSKEIGGGMLGVAGEVLPFAKGLGLAAKGAQYATAGRGAVLAARTADAAATVTKAEKAAQIASSAGKRLATNAAYGAVGSTGDQLLQTGTISPGQTAKDAAASAATGEIIHGGGQLLSHILNRGGAAALKDAQAARAAKDNPSISQDTLDQATTAFDKQKANGDQKLLAPGNIQNNSTSVVKGTPPTLPVSDAEFAQRSADLGKSYDAALKAASQQKGSLAQNIAADQAHTFHENAMEQLHQELANGKTNPAYKPDTTVQSGFQIVPKNGAPAAPSSPVATGQRAQLHQRIGQINSIIKSANTDGTTRTAGELRALMQERQAAQGVLDGKSNYSDVYGNKPGDTKPLPFGDKTTASALPATPGEAQVIANAHPNATNIFDKTLKVAPGDVKGAPLAREFVQSHYNDLAAKTQQLAKGMAPEDIKLLDQLESKTIQTPEQAAARVNALADQAKKPQQFRDVVASMKEGKDSRYLADTQGLGRSMGYIQNHISRVYDHSGAPNPNLPDNQLPGYMKNRVVATKAEAEAMSKELNPDGSLKYPGLKLADVNAVDAHIAAMKSAGYEHGDEAFRQAIEQAHPGAVVGDKVNGLYSSIKLPNGTDISKTYNDRLTATKASRQYNIVTAGGDTLPVKNDNIVKALKDNPGAKLIDAATNQPLNSNRIAQFMRNVKDDPLGAYDKDNANLKYSVLGGGTFHAITTAGSVGGQQLVRAAMNPLQSVKMLGDNLNLLKGTVNQETHDAVMAAHKADGSLGLAKQSGVTLGAREILGDANSNAVDNIKNSRFNPIKQVHDAVFSRQIPQAKMMIFKQSMAQQFKGMDFNNPTPEQVAYARKVSSAVNNLGGINRAVNGMSPKVAKVLSRGLLATDFTEGKFRTIGNALTHRGPEGTIARQMVVGKSLLFALPGLATATVAGKINWKDPKSWGPAVKDQLLDPNIALGSKGNPTKTNPGGATQSIHFPSTFISEMGKMIGPAFDQLNNDKASGVKSYVTNRMAALPAIAGRLIQNKDFSGNAIYGKDAQGNDISPATTALNVASQVSPIPLVQAGKQVSGQQTLRDSALNTLGLRVSADANSATGQHAQAVKDYNLTYDQVSKARLKVTDQMRTAVSTHDYNRAARLGEEFNAQIPARLQPFKTKYADNYNPAYDQKFHSLNISLSPGAFKGYSKADALRKAIDTGN